MRISHMYSQLTLLKASERSIFRNKDESFLVLIAWRAYWAVPMGLCIWQPSRIPSSSIDVYSLGCRLWKWSWKIQGFFLKRRILPWLSPSHDIDMRKLCIFGVWRFGFTLMFLWRNKFSSLSFVLSIQSVRMLVPCHCP